MTRHHRTRPDRPHAPGEAVSDAMTFGQLRRLIERLAEKGTTVDAIERTVGVLLSRRSTEAQTAMMRQLSATRLVPPLRAPRPRAETADAGCAAIATPQPAGRTREPPWFAHLRAQAQASREGLHAMGWHPTPRGDSAPPVRSYDQVHVAPGVLGAIVAEPRTLVSPTLAPGIYALQLDKEGAPREVPPVADVLKRLSRGRSLAAHLRERVGAKLLALGHMVDLDEVRVHDDAAADALCREIGARAFAVGRHVVFRAGLLGPDDDGVALLAHELTHVWQQASGRVPARDGIVDDPSLEAEAERAAAMVPSAGPVLDAAEKRTASPASEGVSVQACGDPRSTETRARGRAPAATPRRAPAAATLDALVSEARRTLAATRTHPAAVFVVTDRITAYDASFRVRGSWRLTGAVPLGPGYWLDGGVGVAGWSTLTEAEITRITGGRADDLWVVGGAAGAAPRAADESAPTMRNEGAYGRGDQPAGTTPPTTTTTTGTTATTPVRPYRLGRWALAFGRRQFTAQVDPQDARFVDVHGPTMQMSVEVVPGAGLPPGHEVGLVQTMHASNRVFVYHDDEGHEVARHATTLGRLMDQDTYSGHPQPPWYNVDVHPLAARPVTTQGADSPFVNARKMIPLATDETRWGELAALEGAESFTTWGVVRRPDGTLDRLCYRAWRVEWQGRVNASGWTFTGGRAVQGGGGPEAGSDPVATSGDIPNQAGPRAGAWTPAAIADLSSRMGF